MPAFLVPANLAFDNYTDLVAAITDWMNRSDLSGAAQSMVALCESRLRRELSPLLLETSASVVVTSGLGDLPSDYSMALRVINGTKILPQFATRAAPVAFTSGDPIGYTIEAGKIRLWPSANVTITLLYQPKLAQLSAANQTTVILQEHPDVYFYGAMLFAEGYVANDSRAATFKALWDEAIAEIKAYLIRQRHAGPLVPKLASMP